MDDFLFNLVKEYISSEKTISSFSDFFTLKNFEKGSYFLRETETNSKIGFLKLGVLRSYVSDYNGNDATIRFIQRGGMVSGGFAFNYPSTVNIQAITAAKIYVANWSELTCFIKENREFLKFLNHRLSVGSAQMTALLSNFIRLSAKGRYELFVQEYPLLLEMIPHYHIANYLGITPVQLSRIRKEKAD